MTISKNLFSNIDKDLVKIYFPPFLGAKKDLDQRLQEMTNPTIHMIGQNLAHLSQTCKYFRDLLSKPLKLLKETYNANIHAEKDLMKNKLYSGSEDPIHRAIVGNQPDELKVLLRAGWDVNHYNSIGETPLNMAIRLTQRGEERVECAKILLMHPEIKIHKKNRNGTSSIDKATNEVIQAIFKNTIKKDSPI